MSLKELFKPDKRKIILTIIFAVVFFILVLSFYMTGFYEKFAKADFLGKLFSVLINLIFGLVLYYPLSCGALFFFDRFFNKKKAKQKVKPKTSDFAVAALVILIFNPFTFGFLYQSTVYVNNNIINTPCGLKVIEFSEISPSRDAGMNVGEVIIRIDGENVINTNLFIHMLTTKKPGDVISITTNLGNYNVKTLQNPEMPSDAYLGIKFKENICERS